LDRNFESFKIGLILRKAREEKQLTQEELATIIHKKEALLDACNLINQKVAFVT
jgi:ribosome-binding protein aMBF1 (putative translation factor)